jgi:CBS domain-containing protein
MRLRDIMTRDVQTVSPQARIPEVARKMREFDVGVIPVSDGNQIVGMITDRDITLRVIAEGRHTDQVQARDIMSKPVVFGLESEDIGDAVRIMEEQQIRRLIVMDRNQRMVGIVSTGDLAVKGANEELTGEVIERISEPVRGEAA